VKFRNSHPGWTDTIYNHLTARATSDSHHFLINPFGLLYSEISASSLVKVDVDGTIIHPGVLEDFGINKAGYVIHSAIHEGRPDLKSVMHTHFREGAGISCTKDGLLPISQTSHTVGEITYHDYEGLAVNTEEKKRLVQDLGNNNIMMLRNHGLITCGKTIPEAFMMMNQLIEASRIQTSATSACLNGKESLIMPSDELMQLTKKLSGNFNKEGTGVKELCAYMRFLDKIDPSYRL
jgi:adducin